MTFRTCAAILAASAVALAIAPASVWALDVTLPEAASTPATTATAAPSAATPKVEATKSAPAKLTDAQLRMNLAWQIALERLGLSPGIIDGKIGAKTRAATTEFQRVRGLAQTGELDAATAAALQIGAADVAGAIKSYTVTEADLKSVGDLPKGWVEKSKASRLPYPSLDEALAEKFHTSRALLARLNSGVKMADLEAGETLYVPGVAVGAPLAKCDRLDIDLTNKIIRASAGGKLVALFHCSVARDKARLPSGEAKVAVVSENPSYTFDPEKWPDVKGITQKLLIPPGPRNPVGLRWIGLSLPGYGIHGTPTPELIGKTGSHGCIRLANWDAVRLAGMVAVGTPVHFEVGKTNVACEQGPKLVTANYEVKVDDLRGEGDVSGPAMCHVLCRKTGQEFTLKGSDSHNICPDGSPGAFWGYKFESRDKYVFVDGDIGSVGDPGTLTITIGKGPGVSEQGVWK